MPLTRVLGLSAYYHDSAAALVVDGEIVAAAQEERFTRVKHDRRFPSRAVEYCLAEGGVSPGELDLVAYYDKPLATFDRLLETYHAFAPRGFSSFRLAIPAWLEEKLRLPREIDRALGGSYPGKLLFLPHHLSHAASAFYPSPFPSAATLTVDGVGEWSTATIGRGAGASLELLKELRFPHSLGLLYSAFTYYLGFKVNSAEYKVMGLAPYGEPRFYDRLARVADLKEDGSLALDMRYFDYCHGLRMTSSAFHDLFEGPPRAPEAPLDARHMDLAASLQKLTNEAVLQMARHARALTGERDLCMAGGVALNCVANGLLQKEKVFDRLFIQPAAGDAGGALGAALFAHHGYLERPRSARLGDALKGSLLGPRCARDEILAALNAVPGARWRELAPGALLDELCARLEAGAVVGVVQGRMEFGPRALGARSILGDARDPGMQSRMNLKIKFRESFRPFAPAVLADDAAGYFDLDCESPYMLLVAPVREGLRKPVAAGAEGLGKLKQLRSEIPAVTHVDYSARVQTVTAESSPFLHRLLTAFKRRTGCGMLVNTSFNVRGEPIVCSPADALRCFLNTDMDVLAVENFLLLKEEQPRRDLDRERYLKEFVPD